MDNLKREQLEAIKTKLRSIYRINEIRVSPYLIDIEAESLLDRLEEIEIEEFERYHEAALETGYEKSPF